VGPLLGEAVGENDNTFDGEQLGVCEGPEIDGEYDGSWLGPNVKIIGVCVGPTVGKGVTSACEGPLLGACDDPILGNCDGASEGTTD